MPPEAFLQSSPNIAVPVFEATVPAAVLVRIELEVEMFPKGFVTKLRNLQYCDSSIHCQMTVQITTFHFCLRARISNSNPYEGHIKKQKCSVGNRLPKNGTAGRSLKKPHNTLNIALFLYQFANKWQIFSKIFLLLSFE